MIFSFQKGKEEEKKEKEKGKRKKEKGKGKGKRKKLLKLGTLLLTQNLISQSWMIPTTSRTLQTSPISI